MQPSESHSPLLEIHAAECPASCLYIHNYSEELPCIHVRQAALNSSQHVITQLHPSQNQTDNPTIHRVPPFRVVPFSGCALGANRNNIGAGSLLPQPGKKTHSALFACLQGFRIVVRNRIFTRVATLQTVQSQDCSTGWAENRGTVTTNRKNLAGIKIVTTTCIVSGGGPSWFSGTSGTIRLLYRAFAVEVCLR